MDRISLEVVHMETPENCGACPCLDDYGDYPRCRISGEQRGYNYPICEKRMPNCPIGCSLPEGHGRLVDADAIKLPKGFFEKVDNVPKFYEWLNSLPTIVPADTAERSET